MKTIENLRENTFFMPFSDLSHYYLDNKKDMVAFNSPFIFNYHSSIFYLYPSVLCTICRQNSSNNWNFPDTFIPVVCMNNSFFFFFFFHKTVTAFLAAMKLADVKLNCPFVHRSFRGRQQKMMKCSISNLCLVFNLQLHIFQSKVLDKQANLPNTIEKSHLIFHSS